MNNKNSMDEGEGMPVRDVGVRGIEGGVAYELLVTDFDWDDKLAVDLAVRHKHGPRLELPTMYLRWRHLRMSRLLHDLHTGSGQCLFEKKNLKR